MSDDVNIRDAQGVAKPISTEEVVSLNGATVPAQHVQRVIRSVRTGDGTVVDEAAAATSAEQIAQTALLEDLSNDFGSGGTAPANGTGVMGWLRGIVDAITTLTGRLPTALSGGRLKTEVTQAAGTTLLVGSSTTPTALPSVSGNVLPAGAGWLCGFTARETTGASSAVFRLRDGSGGTILATVSLVAGESLRERLPDVAFATRVYLELVSGAVEGTVFTR